MIFETLELIKKELNTYLNALEDRSDDNVALGNISQIDTKAVNYTGEIVITLINVEEEKTLKNRPNYVINGDKTEYVNPPLLLNLYILICATSINYGNALKYLSRILQFFLGTKLFLPQNSPSNMDPGVGMEDFRISAELYSPSFEEANFLWSTLGGKQYPSLIYKLGLIKVERDELYASSGLIKEIFIND